MANAGKGGNRRGRRLFAALRRQQATGESATDPVEGDPGAAPTGGAAVIEAPTKAAVADPVVPEPDIEGTDGDGPDGEAPEGDVPDAAGRDSAMSAPAEGVSDHEGPRAGPRREPDLDRVEVESGERSRASQEPKRGSGARGPAQTKPTKRRKGAKSVAEAIAPAPPPDRRARGTETADLREAALGPVELPVVLAIANQKGGVGKTTTAVSLGAALAEDGYRVLIVDLDPQGNATTGLGISHRDVEHSIYDVVINDLPLEDAIEATSVKNLFVAPATIDLAGADMELISAFSREQKLNRAITAVKDDYDFVLIDCPPSLGLLTVNALTAADDVIVPVQCEYLALEGLGQLMRSVALVRSNINPGLEIRGIVLTMFNSQTKLSNEVEHEVRSHFGERVYETVVPRTVRLSEAPSHGEPITVFDPTSKGARSYRMLAQEVSRGATRRSG